jgi:hypothetical protein
MNLKIVNLDEEINTLPFSIMGFPGLVRGAPFISYGEDMVSQLQSI